MIKCLWSQHWLLHVQYVLISLQIYSVEKYACQIFQIGVTLNYMSSKPDWLPEGAESKVILHDHMTLYAWSTSAWHYSCGCVFVGRGEGVQQDHPMLPFPSPSPCVGESAPVHVEPARE